MFALAVVSALVLASNAAPGTDDVDTRGRPGSQLAPVAAAVGAFGSSVARPSGSLDTVNPVLAPTVFGNGVPGALALWLDAKTLGQSSLHQLSGNVGIGTESPASDLDVVGNLSRQLSGTVTANGTLVVGDGQTQFLTEIESGDAFMADGKIRTVVSVDAQDILLVDEPIGPMAGVPAFTDSALLSIDNGAGGPAMLVDKSGRVGLGVGVPLGRLHVGGEPGTDGIVFPDGSLQTTADRRARAAFVEGGAQGLSQVPNWTVLLTVAIEADGPGTVVLQGTMQTFHVFDLRGFAQFGIAHGGGETDAAPDNMIQSLGVGLLADDVALVGTTQASVNVTQAGTYEYKLVALRDPFSPTGSVSVQASSLLANFYPD